MDVVLVLAAVIVGALITGLVVWRWVAWRKSSAFLRDYRASSAYQYVQLRRGYLDHPEAATDQAFGLAADAIVVELGPGFDPRVSAWSRLGSLEPSLLAFVTQHIDLSAEEPLDLEAFAEALLVARQMQPASGFSYEMWAGAGGLGLAFAADWRASQPGRDRDEAFEEAVRVMPRFFQSGAWYWDFERGVAFDSDGRPISGQAVTPSEGVALAPELAELRPSGDRPPGDGPYETRALHTLQLDTFIQLKFQLGFLSGQRQMPDCEGAYVASIVPMDASAVDRDDPLPAGLVVAGTWYERWTLDCGGTRLPFAVAFMPDPSGGTNLSAQLID